MSEKLKSIGIIVEKQLFLKDLMSHYKKYFLKQQDILKTKNYLLLVYSAKEAGKVIMALEEIEIANITLESTEFSKIESLILSLKGKAIAKAKNQALAMTKPLNQKVGNAIYISDLNKISDRYEGMVYSKLMHSKSAIMPTLSQANDPIAIDIQKIKVEAEIEVKFKLE